MKPTIVDIAKLAGVSTATVSRVINNYPYVRSKTREKIMRILEKTNYQPDLVARSMVLQRTHTIGLIVGNITNLFYAETAEVIMEVARKFDTQVVLCVAGDSLDKMQECIELLLKRRVDGIILGTVHMEEPALSKIPGDLPCVYYNRRPLDENVDYVVMDNYAAGFKATQHLIEKGHRSIALISGSLTLWTSLERLRGYHDALAKYGLSQPGATLESNYDGTANIKEIVRKILDFPKRPTAIIATDFLALAAMDCVFEIGLRVPEDIAFVGFDNVQVSALKMIQLSSIAQRLREMATLSVERLLQRIENPEIRAGAWQVTLAPELIVRKSSDYYRSHS